METTTTNIESSSSKSGKTLDDEHLTEKCQSSVFVVTSSLVGLIVGIGIGVMFMIFKQVIKRKKRQDQTTAEANVESELQGETINAYDEVDDISLVLHDDTINQNEENSDTPSTPTSEEQRSHNNLNTDYLNPYQPIIPTTDPHLYMTPVTSTECSNIDQQAPAEDSSPLSNDDKTEGSLKSDSGSIMSRPLHYVELEIKTIISEDNKTPDKYVNTSINANQPTPTQKTQYA